MQVCLPKHNYKLDNNLLTVEPRAVDPHCFDADSDPAQNLDADPDPDPDPGGWGRSAKNVHPPWQNPSYAPGYHIRLACLANECLVDCATSNQTLSFV
jgi:hypothetical protein